MTRFLAPLLLGLCAAYLGLICRQCLPLSTDFRSHSHRRHMPFIILLGILAYSTPTTAFSEDNLHFDVVEGEDALLDLLIDALL